MSVLLDTNILTRVAQTTHPMHPTAVTAIENLRRQGRSLCVLTQNLYEFYVVATRALPQNGLGMTVGAANAKLDEFAHLFKLLTDTELVYPEWKKLVVTYDTKGKPAHDARIAAAMMVHGVGELLTFNGADFKRYAGIVILDPDSVAKSATSTRPTP